jgi:MFS family permease
MNTGLIGGIVGCIIGLVGGIIGTYFSIKNTSSSRERSFIIRVCIIFWIAGISFLACLFFLQSPWRYLLWIPYGILLPISIIYLNKIQQKIRQDELKTIKTGQNK